MFSRRLFVGEPLKVQDYFTSPPILSTERLLLRKVRLRDINDIYQYSCDPEVARYVLWEKHTSKHDTFEYIRYLQAQYRSGRPSSFGIELKETGHLIGTIGFMDYQEEHSCAEVGYSLSRSYWNQNYATEALHCIINYAFCTLHLHRIEAMHDIDNPSSGRVMEKNGMHCEGILRQKVLNKGEYRDVVLYAILRSDWDKGIT